MTWTTLLLGATLAFGPATIHAIDPLNYVDLFIGTTLGGHTFPGATVPHGMVKVGMDTDSSGNHAGYDGEAASNVTGFSQLHQEGTGGGPPLSNFKLFPIANCTGTFEQCTTILENRKIQRKILEDGTPDDFAFPGYFSTNLTNDIRVELTSTRRAALHRYTFPEEFLVPRILIDVSNDGLSSATNPEWSIEKETGRMTAAGNYATSFGPGRYSAYACVDFDSTPIEWGPYIGNNPALWGEDLQQIYYSWGSDFGGMVGFSSAEGSPTTVLARVGVSLISKEQACSNAEEEIPDWDFEGVRKASEDAWSELLGRVQVDVEGVDDNTTTLFYSSLYRTHLLPGDYTGENPHWNSSEPNYDGFYCNWDTYRTFYPLMGLNDPVTYANIVRSLIDIQKNEGWLPECREGGQRMFIQGGSHADPILADFYVKFSEHAEALGVSATDLYAALLADAESQPPNWNIQGRQADIWKELGYIPSDTTYLGGANTKQVSRTLEYAFDDFTIAQVAKLLNNSEDAAKYYERAGNFANVWNANLTAPDDENVVGFMQPRFADGTFNYTDPRHCSPNDPTAATCFLNAIRRDGFYESSPIVYSQYVPQDTAKLIELQGGTDKFMERLDYIFDNNYFDATNEPSQQIPHMYHYADRPGLSTQRIRQTISESFNNSRNGLPGNDDAGAMASYVVFYLAGLYPLPGTRQFLLASPYFPSISFTNPLFNTTTTIEASNLSSDNMFIKGVTINGEDWTSRCYIDWNVFQADTTVTLELTDDNTLTCGDAEDALPPSLSTGGYD